MDFEEMEFFKVCNYEILEQNRRLICEDLELYVFLQHKKK